jgi:hypothetical protein
VENEGGGEDEREDGPGEDSGDEDSGVEKALLLKKVTGRTGLAGGVIYEGWEVAGEEPSVFVFEIDGADTGVRGGV